MCIVDLFIYREIERERETSFHALLPFAKSLSFNLLLFAFNYLLFNYPYYLTIYCLNYPYHLLHLEIHLLLPFATIIVLYHVLLFVAARTRFSGAGKHRHLGLDACDAAVFPARRQAHNNDNNNNNNNNDNDDNNNDNDKKKKKNYNNKYNYTYNNIYIYIYIYI